MGISRRSFMRLVGGAFLSATVPLSAQTEAVDQRPNIILFIVDDMGWQDCAVPFWYPNNGKNPRLTPLNERYKTPQLQRMAREGMVFTSAYAQPVCSPTRVSIMTGMNAARHRVTNWTAQIDHAASDGITMAGCTEANWAVNGLQPPQTAACGMTRSAYQIPGTKYPATREIGYLMKRPYCCAKTLPMVLKEVGYTTLHVGKAHLGAGNGFAETDSVSPGQNPRLLGFDINIGGSHKGQPSGYLASCGAFYGGEVFGLETQQTQGRTLTDALTHAAIDAVEAQSSDKPFLLSLNHFALHEPLDDGHARNPKRKSRSDPEDGLPWNAVEANYCNLIAEVDESLGKMMDWAVERKVRTGRDTLIVMLGDNGGLAGVGQRRAMGENQANTPLRAGKGACYEGGIRVPMMAWLPGKIKENGVCHAPIVCEDVFSTCLDYADVMSDPLYPWGITPAEGTAEGVARVQRIDGISLRNVMEGKRNLDVARPILIHYPNIWGGKDDPAYGLYTVLRMGEWKLIWHHASGEMELYDVVHDLSEQHNQVKRRPSLVTRLAKEMQKRLQECDAQLPLREGKPIQYPLTENTP